MKELIGDDLSFKENIFDKLPLEEGENVEKYKALGDKFNSVGSLAKSYLNLERMLSKEKMPIPTDNDGDEVWNQAYKALGRPESPKDYQAPEGIDPEAKAATDAIFMMLDFHNVKRLGFMGKLLKLLKRMQATSRSSLLKV